MSLLQAEVRQVVKTLREARMAAGLTQKDIAAVVGVSSSTVALVESGSVSDPKLSLVLGYLQALGVEEGWLDRVLPQPADVDYLPEPPPEPGGARAVASAGERFGGVL